MSKTKLKFRHFVLSYCSASVLIANLMCLSQDTLMFRSDLWSLAFVFSTGAFVLGLFFFIGNERGVNAGLITNVIYAFVANAVDLMFGGNAFLFTLPLWPLLFSFFLLRNRQPLIHRIRPLATIWCAFGVLVLVIGFSRRLASPPASAERPNVILLVLDGLGAEALPIFNPEVTNPEFQELAAKARVYTRFYTNFPWTNGFFRTLYTGHKLGHHANPKTRSTDDYLVRWLEAEGVGFKWVVQHQNALPDTHFTLPYAGLRSALMTEHFTWLPRFLGLDYHVFRGNLNDRNKVLLSWMSRPFSKVDTAPLFESEIGVIAKKGRPYLFLGHTFFEMEPPPRTSPKWSEWNGFRKKLDDNDNHYEPGDEATIEEWRQWKRTAIKNASERLLGFVKWFHENKLNENTLLIVTADHGTMFARGKAFYGKHSEEETARVPFLLFGKGVKPGVDPRLFETVDITQTVLDTFGIAKHPNPLAVSVLGTETKKRVTSVTLKGDKHKQQFVSIYTGDEKHEMNVYEPALVRQGRIKGFEWKVEKVPSDLDPKIWKEVLQEYGLDNVSVGTADSANET